MENVREHIYLAALLHDIGKFYQRADTGSVSTSRFLNTVGKQESIFCPLFNDKYIHKHVLWTAQFIDDFSTVLKKLQGSDDADLTDKNNLINLAAGHHLRKDQLSVYGQIIKEADSLSSGMDRDSSEALEEDDDDLRLDSFKRQRMVSIFEQINVDSPSNKYCLPLKEVSLKKEYFPFLKESVNTDPDYSSLWKSFVGELKLMQANTYKAFSETLLNLLQKYTATIPASTINMPDVSLYDHLKTTAAIAVCLYDSQEEDAPSKNPFLLIGADFSGIQSYIYQIVSKYAGKNLKGRSFYLRLLSDAVVRFMLKRLHLFRANVIYNSGGGFYLLAPNTLFVREELTKVICEIEEHFFKVHRTALYVAIDSVEVSKEVLMHKGNKSLGDIWADLFDKRDKKKQSKFADIIESNYSTFFSPVMKGGEAKRDIITGQEIGLDEQAKKFGNSEHYISQLNEQQIELGKVLRETKYIVVSEIELPYWQNDVMHITPANLGFHYYFLKGNDLEKRAEQLKATADESSVITLNGDESECNFIKGALDGINNIYGLDFYGGNRYGGYTFEEMCNSGESAFSRLGVLRMDVDNLGKIFQSGIKAEKATLSRYSALSRSIDYFFSGYLNTICDEISRDKSFIVYSGGDDVFIVGSWDVMIAVAERVHRDFSDFTCHNPAFSISGGIAIVSPTFPIMKAASMSADEESRAKNHRAASADEDSRAKNNGDTKNSISMMSTPFHWIDEYPIVKALKDELVSLLNREKLSKSFLSKIGLFNELAQYKNHVITNMKTYWMLTYDLKRMQKREDKDKNVNNLLDLCIKEVCTVPGTLNGLKISTSYHPLELWAFASRWAELEYRHSMDKQ